MYRFILCFCVALLQLVSEATLSDPIYEGETWVEKDSPLRIVCKIPMHKPHALQWTINNEPLDLSLTGEIGYTIEDDFLESESALLSILSVNRTQPLHAGSYRCNEFSSHGHLVLVLSGDVVETGFKYGQSELILNCSLPDDKVSWYHNGTLVVEADNLKLMHENGVHILKITKPKVAHIGSYTCEGSGKALTDFRVAMEPIVASLSTSFNVVEGENFRLPCVVYGYPTPNIEWRREGEEGQWETLMADGHFMFEPNNEGIANGTLLIEEVKLDDRDNYMCYASNDLGNHNGTTLIRVIDKYAALWPFLGICIEVIVLCSVIFVCEKRRNKKQFEEPDNEQNNTKHTGNAKDSEVRNRK